MTEQGIKQVPSSSSSSKGGLIATPPRITNTGALTNRVTRSNEIDDLHRSPDELDHKIQNITAKAGGIVKDTINASSSSISGLYSNIKSKFHELNNAKNGKAQKTIFGLASLGFFVFALKSTMEFFTNMYRGDGTKNNFLKFLDAGVKWLMGFTAFNGFTNKAKSFKLNNINQLLMGAGVSTFFGQMTGINEGKTNIMQRLARVTGSDTTLKNFTDWFTLIPRMGAGIGLKG